MSERRIGEVLKVVVVLDEVVKGETKNAVDEVGDDGMAKGTVEMVDMDRGGDKFMCVSC
jgi:hypothetical protein